MPVICAVCNTENRDAAMFCHGCARKLPAFAATGPSLLESMKSKRSGGTSFTAGTSDGPGRAVVSAEMRRFWIRIGLLLLAIALAFFGWFVYVTRKVPSRPPETAKIVSAPPAPSRPPAPAVAVPPKAQEPPKPVDPVPLGNSLAAGEVEVAPGPAATPAQPAVVSAPPPSPERRQPPRAAPPPRAMALDPRSGCETLNFIFAARCEAAHCDKPEYTRHPRCDLVREERRRDEARRNPTLGF
ncbi:hypothetical protein QTH90_31230 [Variovorax sp. J2P1-59]|uniref:hypothetical protein n=1 Tax=Variovorax flavidus TaxID=3053501 RepID=UPI002578D61D|nr:hypothetical protein [Variovorax sp. J2P1-59]MDM0078915.1 hypothetical protein [Variovorax sp. J2P1-59]